MTRDIGVVQELGSPLHVRRIVKKDLGTLGGTVSSATGINDNGDIIGESMTERGETHAFLWRAGRMFDLGTLGGNYSRATAISSRGYIIGESKTAAGASHAFLWQNGRMFDLGSLAGPSGFSSAAAINNRGDVVGTSSTRSGEVRAFIWFHWPYGESRGMQELRTLGGSTNAARSINDQGMVVGFSETRNGMVRACVWQGGKVIDTGAPPAPYEESLGVVINEKGQVAVQVGAQERTKGALWKNGVWDVIEPAGFGDLSVTGMNDYGQLIGQAREGLLGVHGYLWQSGVFTELAAMTAPGAINNLGLVVGNGTTADGTIHAFGWEGGAAFELGSLGDGSDATAVNNRGQVVGESRNVAGSGEDHATLWTVY